MTSRRMTTFAGAALAASLLLAGCSGSSEGPAQVAPPPPGETPTSAQPSTSTTAVSKNGAAEAGVDPATAKPIATATVGAANSEDPKATLTIGLLGLERRDKLMYLTASVQLSPEVKNEAGSYGTSVAILSRNGFKPSAIDPVGLKEYGVVKTADGTELKSNQTDTAAQPGQTMYLYAVLAAPPADVTTVDVNVWPGAPTFTGVQIR